MGLAEPLSVCPGELGSVCRAAPGPLAERDLGAIPSALTAKGSGSLPRSAANVTAEKTLLRKLGRLLFCDPYC